MNLKYLMILLVAFITICSCNNNSNKVVISGKLEQAKANKVVLNSNNTRDTTLIGRNNEFSLSLDLIESSYFNLNANSSNIQLFLSPGDSINILIEQNGVEISGNNKSINKYLLHKSEYKASELGSLIKLFNLQPKAFTNKTDSVFDSLFVSLIKLEIEKKALIFTALEKQALAYEKAQLHLEYASMSPNNYLIDKSFYFSFLDDLSLSDSSLLKIPSFNYFIDAYVNWLTSQETIGKGELFAHEYTLIKMQVISRNFATGKIKDQLLYNTLNEHIKFKGLKNTDLLFKTFMFQCNNKALKNKLSEPYEKYLAMNNGKKAPAFKLLDLENNIYTLADFKGKYIYIDVWATWCKPCIEEAPYFEALKEKYTHKNIEFVSISVDKEKEKWQRFCDVKNKNDQQYWVENAKEFLDSYFIKTIPHFILIDTEGKIIKVNANRPSDNNNEWLEELDEKVEV